MRWSIAEGLKKTPPRQPTPDQLKLLEREPEVDAGTRYMARAFAELSTERQAGFSAGPIPWSAMVRWCRYHGMERDTSDHLVRTVGIVDGIFRRRWTRQSPTTPQQASASRAPAPTTAPRRRR